MFAIIIACTIAIVSAVLTTRSANLLDARARLLDLRARSFGFSVSAPPCALSAEELGAKFSEMLAAAKRDAGALS